MLRHDHLLPIQIWRLRPAENRIQLVPRRLPSRRSQRRAWVQTSVCTLSSDEIELDKGSGTWGHPGGEGTDRSHGAEPHAGFPQPQEPFMGTRLRGPAERAEQLWRELTVKRLAGRFHIPGRIGFGDEGAELRIRQQALVGARVIHLKHIAYVRTQPAGSRIELYRANARDFQQRWYHLLRRKLPVDDHCFITQLDFCPFVRQRMARRCVWRMAAPVLYAAGARAYRMGSCHDGESGENSWGFACV